MRSYLLCLGRLAAVGIDMKDAFTLFDHFNPGQRLPQRGKRISSWQYSPPPFEGRWRARI